MSARHFLIVTTIATCATVLTALAVAPVEAVERRFPDRDGGGGTAITYVRVANAGATLTVVIGHRSRLAADNVWIDSRPADYGPEYVLVLRANSNFSFPGAHVDGFDDEHTTPWRCRGARLHSDNLEPGAVSRATIPQRCVRGPGRVRVHVESFGGGDGKDRAPNFGTYAGRFTPWIARGR